MVELIDLFIINNCPSFYKVNLYNEISQTERIFVVFIGISDEVIIDEDFEKKIKFPYIFLNKCNLAKRSVFRTFFRIKEELQKHPSKKIIYGGYMLPELIILPFFTSRNKNVLQTESASETKLNGLKFYFKKLLLKRYSEALASGKIHAEMLHKMGFSGRIKTTQGVGIIDKKRTIKKKQLTSDLEKSLTFLYVGRLIEIKNISRLIKAFNENGLPLTIVGKGVLGESLKSKANSNITFAGFVPNSEIYQYYLSNNVFILPSLAEPWGLVVEEALFYGCTLLLSNRVGSLHELMEVPDTGISFDPENMEDIQNAIQKMAKKYSFYLHNVEKFDLDAKDLKQIEAYSL